MSAPMQITVPPGMLVVTTYGIIQFETTKALLDLRSFSEKQGLNNVAWEFVSGSLVDRARNQAVVQMLRHPGKLQWLCFVDGDCVFPPDALVRLLGYAYHENPQVDIVGAYNPLRGEPYLPTIDTGTGTWESHFPGAGPLEVMRTGSACIVLKRHVYERLEGPWYGTRQSLRPIDILTELDNYANQKFDGRNPLAATAEWQALLGCARQERGTYQPQSPETFVGEDSNLCDRARAAGMHLVVHTDIVCGHVDRKVITWRDHKASMDQGQEKVRLACGIIGS